MSLFDDIDDIDDMSLEDDISLWVSRFNKDMYYNLLGEILSVEINNNDEKLFDVLKRELFNWLVCDKPSKNDIKFEIDDAQSPVYESGICRYGQYSPSEKKITLFIKNIPDDEFAEIKASTILHELMHAYFDCGLSGKPDLEFIEEPLAEAGMLDFLYQCNNGQSFKNVLKSVTKKKDILCIAHYGFGAFIHQQSDNEIGTLYELYYKILHKCRNNDVKNFIEGLNEYGEYKKIVFTPSPDDKKYELLRSILKKVEKECK